MKKVVIIIFVLIALGGGYVIYLFNKPHRDLEGEEAKYELNASEIIERYTRDENGANAMYLDAVVKLDGILAEAEPNHIKLESGVYCNGDFSNVSLEVGSPISVKGRVVGYDELFGEVTLDNCVLLD